MSIKKTYIPAKPRSSKLVGTSMSGGVAGGVSSSLTGSTDPNSHSHLNKRILDTITQEMLDNALREMLGVESTEEVTDENFFSALRTLAEILKNNETLKDLFLSKLEADTAKGKITFEQGLVSQALTKLVDTQFGDFQSGMHTGQGGAIDSAGNAELESLVLRSFLEVPSIRYNELEYIGEEIIIGAGAVLKGVEHLGDDRYRLTLKLEDGQFNPFRPSDLLKGIYNMDEGGNFTGFGTTYVSVSSIDEHEMIVILADESDVVGDTNMPPRKFMHLARIGNFTDTDRQSYISLSAKDRAITQYGGVNAFARKNKQGLNVRAGTVTTKWGRAEGLEFIENWEYLPVTKDDDVLYTDTLLYNKQIKVDYEGIVIKEYIDRGQWFEGMECQVTETTIDEVWIEAEKFRLIDRPIENDPFVTTEKPTRESEDWTLILSIKDDIESTVGDLNYENRNLLIKYRVTKGRYIDFDTGELVSSGAHEASDFIDVTEKEDYTAKGWDGILYNTRIGFYDSDKNYLSYIYSSNTANREVWTFKIPQGASFLRISSDTNSGASEIKLEKGKVATDYSEAPEDTIKRIEDSKTFYQWSVDGETGWHFPAEDGDKYFRQKVGTDGAWSGAVHGVGKDGTSVAIVNTVASVGDLNPNYTGEIGDGFISVDDGHLHVWTGSVSKWRDAGRIQGEDGKRAYLHIAYADTASGGGFSQSPVGKEYMSTYADFLPDDDQSKFVEWLRTKGEKGETGVAVSHVQVMYILSSSPTTPPPISANWKASVEWVEGQYIWTKTITFYDDGFDPTESTPINITPKDGREVVDVVAQFNISNSKTNAPTSGWSENASTYEWTQGMYLWTRSKITYNKAPLESFTTAQVSSEWEAINNIEIGGRNLFIEGTALQGKYVDQADGTLRDSSAHKASDFIEVQPNQEYILSAGNGVIYYGRYAFYDELYTFIKGDRKLEVKTFTFESPNNAKYVRVSSDINTGGSLFKFEKGNKATDWTPAPEDVQAEIDAAKKAGTDASAEVVAMESSLTSMVNTVADALEDKVIDEAERKTLIAEQKTLDTEQERLLALVNSLLGSAYLVGDANTALSEASDETLKAATGTLDIYQMTIDVMINADKITAAMISAYEGAYDDHKNGLSSLNVAIENARKAIDIEVKRLSDEKVDSLEIGGRNLIISSEYENSRYVNLGDGVLVSAPTHRATGFIKVSGDTYYTLSATILYNTRIVFFNDDKEWIDSTYISGERSKNTLKTPIGASYVRFSSEYSAGRATDDWKFERGAKPTDWTPSPEDVQAEIDEAKQGVSDLGSEIGKAFSNLSITNIEANNLDLLRKNLAKEVADVVNIATSISVSVTDVNSKLSALNTEINKYANKADSVYPIEVTVANRTAINTAFTNIETSLVALYAAIDNKKISSSLTNFTDTVIANLQEQIDGVVDNWFYAYVPTNSNYPANEWTNNALKDRHIGDTFTNVEPFVSEATTPHAGKSWRWVKDGSTYKWTSIADSDAVKALLEASKAQDTADGKRRVFTTTPKATDAYDVGDLWTNATHGTTYTNDLLRCKTAKAKGGAFSIAHWEKASKYTDDTAINELEIGGRNLFTDSEKEIELSNTTDSNIYYTIKSNFVLEPNSNYTLSYDVKGNGQWRHHLGLYDNDTTSVSCTGVTGVGVGNNIEMGLAPSGYKRFWFLIKTGDWDSPLEKNFLFGYSKGDFSIRKFKLEKGNKATDWTPAPEDVQAEIDGLEGYMEGAFQDSVIDKAEAKAIGEHLKTINDRYVTDNALYNNLVGNSYLRGAVRTTLQNVMQSVYRRDKPLLETAINNIVNNKTVTTPLRTAFNTAFVNYRSAITDFQTAVENARKAIEAQRVDDLEIGGRNLIISSEYENGRYVNLSDGVLMSSTAHRTTGFIKVSGDTYYTLSATILYNTRIVFFNDDKEWIDSTYISGERSKNTLKTPIGASYVRFSSEYSAGQGTDDWKFEKGNKATDWTPSPEDVQAEIDEAVVKATFWSINHSSPVIYKDAINAVTSGTHSTVIVKGELHQGTNIINGGFITVTPNGGAEGTATASPVTIAPANADGKTNYTVRLYDTASKTTLLDSQTIPVVFKGASGVNAINASLSNDADVLPASPEGVVSDYSGSGTEIRVFEGATELSYGTGNGQYQVSASGSGIKAGTPSTSGNKRVYGVVSNMTSDNATITFTITGKTASGASFSLTKVQTFAKSRTGQKGDKGEDGKSITLVDVQYAVNTSSTTPPIVTSSLWKTLADTLTGSQQLWTRTKTTYSVGDPTYTTPANITPKTGGAGADGNSITSITEWYYLSTSKTALTGGSWSTTPWTWINGRFIWTKTVFTYSKTADTETLPIVSSEWEAINELEIGGRNLIISSEYENGRYVNLPDGVLVSAATHRATGFIKVSGDTYYTLSATKLYNTRIVFFNDDKEWIDSTYISGERSKHTLKTPVGASYVRFSSEYSAGQGTDDWKFERGTKATDYTPAPEDDIEIGGTNLLSGLNREYYLNNTGTSNVNMVSKDFNFKRNSEYIISYDIKGVGQTSLGVSMYDYPISTISSDGQTGSDAGGTVIFPLTDEWKRVWVKIKTANWSDEEYSKPIRISARANSEVYIRDIMFVSGNKAFDWSPAPEDVDAEIEQAKAIPYQAGEYKPNTDYIRTSNSYPIVSYGESGGAPLYYALIGSDGKNKQPNLAANKDIWENVTSFKQVFTEVLFAEFAKLDSFVFNGGKMFSQMGDRNGVANSPDYRLVGHKPYFEVDGITGKARMKDAEVEGTVVTAHANGSKTIQDGQGFRVMNPSGVMNIRFGIKDGYSVLEYYDNDGKFLYDIGPTGIGKIGNRGSRWEEIHLINIGSSMANVFSTGKYKTIHLPTTEVTTYYKYVSGVILGELQDPDNHGKIFRAPQLTALTIPSAVYAYKFFGEYEEVDLMDGTNPTQRIYPPMIHASNPRVNDVNPLYVMDAFAPDQDSRLQMINKIYWHS